MVGGSPPNRILLHLGGKPPLDHAANYRYVTCRTIVVRGLGLIYLSLALALFDIDSNRNLPARHWGSVSPVSCGFELDLDKQNRHNGENASCNLGR
jgi:hypothetical protein